MTISNNPENLKSNGQHDLGRITLKPCESKAYDSRGTEEQRNPNPWVVVEFPGTDREQIVIDYPTAREAFRFIERNYTEDECDVDVMRRRDDGVLTTEF